MNEFKTNIYLLKDPISNEVRYVGKSDNPDKRFKEHIKKAKYSKTHKNNWILSLKDNGLIPILEIIDQVPSNECGFWEQHWIDQMKSWGFSLTNIANGGVGGNLGLVVNRKISEKKKGIKFSLETINKMKIAAKNRKLSDIGRKNLSISRMGKGNSMYGKKRPESSKHYRKVIQLDENNNVIKIWSGLTLASKELRINRCTISDVCNNRRWRNTAGGYKWKYFN
jgi:group I intron endonuclease